MKKVYVSLAKPLQKSIKGMCTDTHTQTNLLIYGDAPYYVWVSEIVQAIMNSEYEHQVDYDEVAAIFFHCIPGSTKKAT